MYVSGVTYRSERPQPKDCVDGDWPLGELRAGTVPSAAAARQVAISLRRHMLQPSRPVPWTARSLAKAAGVAPATVTNILNGVSWCDIDTLARLEQALGVKLWGDDHLTQANQPKPSDHSGHVINPSG